MLRARLAAVGIASLGLLAAGAAPCANRDALRQIVLEQCVAHWLQQHIPAPCERVFLAGPQQQNSGYAVLADRKGGAHFLLIPTRVISGIESPALLEPSAPNYFSAAWQARDRIAAAMGRPVPRSAVGLAVNPLHARSQDQLHIHIECLSPDVARAISRAAERISGTWSPVTIRGSSYSAVRILGEDLDGANPFRILADRMPQPNRAMADFTLVIAGMQFDSGPGFILLAGTGPAGELLLDSTCDIAGI
jgi:CDP-diacylglycerol pyrophosphatase